MNKEEYIKYVESHEELNRICELSSSIGAIVSILIKKGICKIEEFEKIKQEYKKKIIDNSYARETQEDLEAVKTIGNFINTYLRKEE